MTSTQPTNNSVKRNLVEINSLFEVNRKLLRARKNLTHCHIFRQARGRKNHSACDTSISLPLYRPMCLRRKETAAAHFIICYIILKVRLYSSCGFHCLLQLKKKCIQYKNNSIEFIKVCYFSSMLFYYTIT